MNTTKREKTIKELVIGKCWDYINDNFHKFNESNQIKIALALCTKDIPQEIEGSLRHTIEMPTIQKGSVKLEFNIG